MKRTGLYDALALVLTYPTPAYKNALAHCAEILKTSVFHVPMDGWQDFSIAGETVLDPNTAYASFHAALEPLATNELEELFTRTFDINPVCCLEAGWHLYGENYERGAFLVQMREHLRRFHLTESSELPDHLTHVLRVLGRFDVEEGRLFARTYVLPALEKMRAGFETPTNPYASFLSALSMIITANFPVPISEATHE